jgi:hypothetical protein
MKEPIFQTPGYGGTPDDPVVEVDEVYWFVPRRPRSPVS